ncbi:hypothetical protein MAR_019995 [Mya arenaria]|uniref:Uncharacterized protein n=1 Tax=Mya arenaria TaxID=6604 RepID=A0ABY7E6R5_MYAAR|nr:hypothetical protein MAR_019995 [Mya arenaria]
MMMNAITKLTSVINYVRTKKGRIAAPVDQDICWTQIIALVQNLGRSHALPQPKTEYSGQMHMMDRYLDTNHVVTDTKVLNGSLNFTEALTKLKPETNTFTEADVNLLTAGELQTVNKILDKAIDDIELNTDTTENDTDVNSIITVAVIKNVLGCYKIEKSAFRIICIAAEFKSVDQLLSSKTFFG